MPKVHTAPVKPINRSFAVQNNAVRHVDVGALKETSASVDEEHAPKKKDRRILKHELFIERLEASRAPYSKSHARRLKRKEKEQLAGGLGSLKMALPCIIARTAAGSSAGEMMSAGDVDAATAAVIVGGGGIGGASAKSSKQPIVTPGPPGDAMQQPTRPGQIGEGKGIPLTKSQRRRALKAEHFRQRLIRSNPEFVANPFETIRTHARNTLVPHRPTTEAIDRG